LPLADAHVSITWFGQRDFHFGPKENGYWIGMKLPDNAVNEHANAH
jgi:hypothetical protein